MQNLNSVVSSHSYVVPPIIVLQGEQNADCGGPYQPEYYRMLETMVLDWREKFQQPDLAFGNCLLAAWKSSNLDSFPLLRLAQANITRLPKTFLISAIDRGDPNSGAVHSPYKQDVGRRAALGIADVALGHTTMYRGPTYLSAAAAAVSVDSTIVAAKKVASNDGSVTVKFEPIGLYGKAPIINRSVTCPSTIPASSCESFAVLAAPDCVWVSADAVIPSQLSPSGITLRPTNWTAGQQPVATRGYFANWPVVMVTNYLGMPATQWLEYVDPKYQPCALTPPPQPPSPPPPPPAPCVTTAPKGYVEQAQQGWWSNYTKVSVGGHGTVPQCAAACSAYGSKCSGFHVWEPCAVGDCYVFLGGLSGFAQHPDAYAYRRNIP